MQKRRGKAWKKVTCVTLGRREGRHEGSGAWRRVLRSFLQYFVQEIWTVTFERQYQYSSLFGRLEADNAKFVSYNCRSPPPLCLPSRLPSLLPDVTHVTPSPRPSTSIFAYCKQSKIGGDNGLGTRLTPNLVVPSQNPNLQLSNIAAKQ